MPEQDITFMIEGAEILYPNFSGRASQFNLDGARTFNALLDPAVAEQMSNDGWNIRETKIREEGDVARPFIEVTIGYKFKPPIITLITSTGRSTLTEDTVGMLDDADIQNIDFIARGYRWELATGKSGIKAYLKTMFVTINEDPLMRKYAVVDG